nr:hypothetical protein KK1_020177 [Ipomoea batatas]
MVWPEPPASGRKTAGGMLSFLPPILIADRATVYARGSSLGGEGEAAMVHSQNALSLAGLRGASEDQRRGSLGFGKRNFFPDEIALGVGSISVEVGIVAELLLVARSGEAGSRCPKPSPEPAPASLSEASPPEPSNT